MTVLTAVLISVALVGTAWAFFDTVEEKDEEEF